jgi:hypothetical protein
MSCDKTARIIIKQGQGVPTIPVSTDHRNGDWIATDIYDGEFYQDTNTGLVYTRNGSIISMADGRKTQNVWKANISQTSTNAPVITVIENSLGVTITSAYSTPGIYFLNGFDGNLVNPCEIIANNSTFGSDENFTAAANTASQLVLSSQLAGVDSDNVIGGVGTTVTVIKY